MFKSWLSNWWSGKKDEKIDIIPQKVYNAIDWKRCMIGGSYALKQFENAGWEANDIDVFVAVTRDEDEAKFKEIVSEYVKKTDSSIHRGFRSTEEARKQKTIDGSWTCEDFHSSIVGTIEVDTKGISKKMQFVGFRTYDLLGWHHELISIMDAPACILYTLTGTGKCFIVGDQYTKFKQTGLGKLICESRRKKYEERGYK